MKFKTTRKELLDKVSKLNLFKCGYGDLQHILQGVEPIAYTSGIYGWNFDIYCINNTYITTGYRGMIGQPINRDIINKFDKLARFINNRYIWKNSAKRQELMQKLQDKFIKALYN